MFQLLEVFITERFGYQTLDTVLVIGEPALMTRDPYVGPGLYPDDDFITLIAIAARQVNRPEDHLLREFGHFCFGQLAARFRWAVSGHRDYAAFLASLERTIHREFGRLMPDNAPELHFEIDADQISIEYRSAYGLCALTEGLLEGGATHFGSRLALVKQTCQRRGDDRCRWRGSLSPSRELWSSAIST